jgi:hypothetical protein
VAQKAAEVMTNEAEGLRRIGSQRPEIPAELRLR